MKKYDVEKYIESFEENSDIDKLDDIKVMICGYKKYYLKYKGKKYPYQNFSKVFKLQEYDKKVFKKTETSYKLALYRSLKLSCSLDLGNPKLVLANTLNDKLASLITYQENGNVKVIDYAKNMIMDKDKYYELFEVKE